MIETISPIDQFVKPLFVGNSIPIIAIDNMPVMFEDEGQEEMGDSAPHSTNTEILDCGIRAHLEEQPVYQVYTNLNVHYHPIRLAAYFSPDVMIVAPFERLPDEISSYRIGEDGPAPVLAGEVLSRRTAQQGDLTMKPEVYSECKVAEYLLVDPSGKFLPQRLLIRRLQPDGSWLDSQDTDGGVTSALGFRIVIEDDGRVRVINAATGHRYARPHEAESTVRKAEEDKRQAEEARRQAEEARRQAEERERLTLQRIKEIEAELARLKNASPKQGD
jgi:Uma2 family endonuclease